ncbi:MAG TPA: UPF0158 family protein [Acidobacteriota bacterium]|nr:UPF0158 family protein [Acidobacteriota bacterium]
MVKLSDIEHAFLFVNWSDGGNTAVLQKSTGRIFYSSELGDVDEVDDLDQLDQEGLDWDDMIEIPRKSELDLGQHLVFRFAQNRLPGEYDRVRRIFSRRGAYSRFKQFLDERDLLQSWYDFENEAEKQALLEWCQENGIEVSA